MNDIFAFSVLASALLLCMRLPGNLHVSTQDCCMQPAFYCCCCLPTVSSLLWGLCLSLGSR